MEGLKCKGSTASPPPPAHAWLPSAAALLTYSDRNSNQVRFEWSPLGLTDKRALCQALWDQRAQRPGQQSSPPAAPLLPSPSGPLWRGACPVPQSQSPPFLHMWVCMCGHWGVCATEGSGTPGQGRTGVSGRSPSSWWCLGKMRTLLCVQSPHGLLQFSPSSLLALVFLTSLSSHLSCPHFPLSSLQPVSHTCPPRLFTLTPVLSCLSLHACPPHWLLQICVPHSSPQPISYICPLPPVPHACPLPYLSPPMSSHPCSLTPVPLPLTHGTVEVLAAPAGPSAWGRNKTAHSCPGLQTCSR